MTFVTIAQNFLNNPGSLKSHPYYSAMRDTVEYLLSNAVGIRNAVSTDNIIAYLRRRGHRIYREEWQINVLGPLRDNGIFIGSKVGTGMFIIETIDDAREVVASIEHRINVEQSRLKILREIAHQSGWIL